MNAKPLAAVFLSALVGLAGSAPTQSRGAGADTTRIDSLYFASQVAQSLALCERDIAVENRLALQWRAARADIAMGMMITESPRRKELYDSALAHARRAFALDTNAVVARYAIIAAAGRRTHRDDPILSIKLAYEVYAQVTAILAVDSLHAGAHHALGSLNRQVLRAPRFVRFMAKNILRLDLAKRASWPEAELHLRRAVALDPGMMQYQSELADLYGEAGRIPSRDSVLARIRVMPLVHPFDRNLRDAVLARWAAPTTQR